MCVKCLEQCHSTVNVTYYHLLSAYYMPVKVLDAGDVEIDKTENVLVLTNL